MKKTIIINEKTIEIDLLDLQQEEIHFELEGERYKFNLQMESCGKIFLKDRRGQNSEVFGYRLPFKNGMTNKNWHYISSGRDLFFELAGRGKKKKKSDQEGQMLSPMPGQVVKVLVEEGQEVSKNEPLIVLEAMKMEHTIRSNCKGMVKKVFFDQGDLVGGEVELLELVPAKEQE